MAPPGAAEGTVLAEKKQGAKERAILIGVSCTAAPDFDNSDEETMHELRELLETAGGEAVLTAAQNRKSPDSRTLIGEGKCAEIRQLIKSHEIDLAVFDNELGPSQTRALEQELDCRVIDRNALILDIFADRAQTREGKLQVELAQYQYLLPRLSGMWGHLVRQTAAGGSSPIGTRGPGETQLETDRRHIRRKIQKLKEEIEDVKRVRAVQRRSREKASVPLVCIVGYTNAGKSTLLNALTGAGVHAEGRLFDTLDPTTKSLITPDGTQVLVSDTVGFIRQLPHHLVNAFRATLEEVTYADVLVHVIDVSNPRWREQAVVVDKLVGELGAGAVPHITVFNKVDLVHDVDLPRQAGAVYCSALLGRGLDELMQRMVSCLSAGRRRVSFVLPYASAALLDELYREASVKRADYAENGIEIEAVVDARMLGRLRDFLPKGENADEAL